ncbi:hypothetical protein J437_LFUL004079 [Ladona fulva]|uniref:Uncharacterized protein n=1 Tax=Ladona fulva TaxID=123851 RepID=A0A8K0NXS4_LADFU|nr:hypothetical protein J437_LFUL004079 [Ladona fulva]
MAEGYKMYDSCSYREINIEVGIILNKELKEEVSLVNMKNDYIMSLKEGVRENLTRINPKCLCPSSRIYGKRNGEEKHIIDFDMVLLVLDIAIANIYFQENEEQLVTFRNGDNNS